MATRPQYSREVIGLSTGQMSCNVKGSGRRPPVHTAPLPINVKDLERCVAERARSPKEAGRDNSQSD
jgi:hypothetical protein